MAYWKDRSVLVTGGTGFIGSWVSQKLVEQEAEVTVLSSGKKESHYLQWHGLQSKVRVIQCDLRNFESMQSLLQQNDFETIFHFASQSIPSKSAVQSIETLQANIEGTWNLLESARNARRLNSLVLASTIRVYDSQYKTVSEETPLNGSTPYDASKSSADLLAKSYHQTYGIPLAISRCTYTFGGIDLNWSRVVPRVLSQAIQGKTVELKGDGKLQREYLYVEDTAEANMLLAKKASKKGVRGEAFNFSSGKTVSIQQFAKQLVQGAKSDSKIEFDGIPFTGEPAIQRVNSNKAKKVLDWKPKFSMEDGIQKTVSWYQHYFKKGGNAP